SCTVRSAPGGSSSRSAPGAEPHSRGDPQPDAEPHSYSRSLGCGPQLGFDPHVGTEPGGPETGSKPGAEPRFEPKPFAGAEPDAAVRFSRPQPVSQRLPPLQLARYKAGR